MRSGSTPATILAALVILLLVLGISAGMLEAGNIADITNLREHTPTLMSSGQPSKSQIAALPEAGIEVVINLSPTFISGSIEEEEELVVAQGMKYFHIPVDWNAPSFEDFEKFLVAMAESNGAPVLVHCRRNARASAIVYLYRVKKKGAPQDQEYEVMEETWENNLGYELRNVRQWRRFLDTAIKKYK